MRLAIRRATSILVIVLVMAGLACSAYFEAVRTNWTRVDFAPYLAAVNRMKDKDPLYVYNKENLYTSEQYLYPPLPALVLRPLAGSNLNTLCHAWTAVEIIVLAAAIFLFCFAVRLDPVNDLGTVLLICITAFFNYPTKLQILIGNIDMQILFCLVAVLAASRFKRWNTAALLISLAASIKTWAIVFSLYLIIMRQWKQAALAVSAFLLAGAATFAVLGLDEFCTFAKLQQAYSYQPKLNSNSIIPMCRLYSGSPTLEHHRPPMLFPGADTLLPLVGIIATLAVIAVFMVIAWRIMKAPDSRQTPLVMSFCIITYLLLTPLCHQCYYVLSLPVIWSLIVYSDSKRRLGHSIEDDWVGVTMWAGALVAFMLLLVEAPGLLETNAYPGFAKLAYFGYGQTILAGLALWLTTAVALISGQAKAVDQCCPNQGDQAANVFKVNALALTGVKDSSSLKLWN